METMELLWEFGSELPGKQREKWNPINYNSQVQGKKSIIPQGKRI